MLTIILFVIAATIDKNAGMIYIATFIMDMCLLELITDRIKAKELRGDTTK